MGDLQQVTELFLSFSLLIREIESVKVVPRRVIMRINKGIRANGLAVTGVVVMTITVVMMMMMMIVFIAITAVPAKDEAERHLVAAASTDPFNLLKSFIRTLMVT